MSGQPSERKRERGREREKDMSTKKPASLMHFTTLAPGKAALNLSQCNMEDKPPAEHPPSRALSAFTMPLLKSSAIIASQILSPL
jgi:hypothetical protein